MTLGEIVENYVVLGAFTYSGNTGGVVYVRGTNSLFRYVDNGAGMYKMDARQPYDPSCTDLDAMVETAEDWHFAWAMEQEDE